MNYTYFITIKKGENKNKKGILIIIIILLKFIMLEPFKNKHIKRKTDKFALKFSSRTPPPLPHSLTFQKEVVPSV
jgi:hypothetical protein